MSGWKLAERTRVAYRPDAPAGVAPALASGMLLLRPARETDGPALARIDTLTRTWTTSPGGPRQPDEPFWTPRTAPEDTLIAQVGPTVAGYAVLTQALRLPSHRHVLEVSAISIDPSKQGRGVGRALLEGTVTRARERGARKVSLRVLGSNPRARALYARCGFEVEGVLRGEFLLEGVFVDDVLMARHL